MSGRDERGAAVLIGVALIGLLAIAAVAVMFVEAAVAAHRRAQSAADLSALGAAAALRGGGQPCERAATLATRNGARLSRCRVEDWDVRVTVVAHLALPVVGETDLGARAHAGPGR